MVNISTWRSQRVYRFRNLLRESLFRSIFLRKISREVKKKIFVLGGVLLILLCNSLLTRFVTGVSNEWRELVPAPELVLRYNEFCLSCNLFFLHSIYQGNLASGGPCDLLSTKKPFKTSQKIENKLTSLMWVHCALVKFKIILIGEIFWISRFFFPQVCLTLPWLFWLPGRQARRSFIRNTISSPVLIVTLLSHSFHSLPR